MIQEAVLALISDLTSTDRCVQAFSPEYLLAFLESWKNSGWLDLNGYELFATSRSQGKSSAMFEHLTAG